MALIKNTSKEVTIFSKCWYYIGNICNEMTAIEKCNLYFRNNGNCEIIHANIQPVSHATKHSISRAIFYANMLLGMASFDQNLAKKKQY